MKKLINDIAKKLYVFLSEHVEFDKEWEGKKKVSLCFSREKYSPALGLMVSNILNTLGCDYKTIQDKLGHRSGFYILDTTSSEINVILDTTSSINLVLKDNHISVVYEVK